MRLDVVKIDELPGCRWSTDFMFQTSAECVVVKVEKDVAVVVLEVAVGVDILEIEEVA
jgi:hypothetical protein